MENKNGKREQKRCFNIHAISLEPEACISLLSWSLVCDVGSGDSVRVVFGTYAMPLGLVDFPVHLFC